MKNHRLRFTRREILKASVGGLLLPASSYLWAASGNDAKRDALIIGNANYRDSPLTNPINDASDIGKVLTGLGFNTQLLLNANLNQITEAIKKHGEHVKKHKSIGLFYYAGHGVQLGWRNYLVPIGANIDTVNDIPAQCYELNTFLGILNSASNPMNIIMLDACRDNPFGKRLPVEQKGLSQFDAPNGSLLAYATAPGNVASDGSGKNGLYTECFLKEVTVPEAKIEDVMKRVRLNVRLKSKGRQVPWESTSLEEDFYFNKSSSNQDTSLKDKQEAFNEELASWKDAEQSHDLKPVEAYLFKYPSGIYSQLAQAKLDLLLQKNKVKSIQIINSAKNPYTKGTASGIGKYVIGDKYEYVEKDLFSGKVEKTYTAEVSKVTDSEVRYTRGTDEFVQDRLGNPIPFPGGRFLSQPQIFASDYSVGKTWSTIYDFITGDGQKTTVEMNFRVIDRKAYESPTGTANAFLIEGHGSFLKRQNSVNETFKYWIDPDVCPTPLATERITQGLRGRGFGDATRKELISVTFAKRAT